MLKFRPKSNLISAPSQEPELGTSWYDPAGPTPNFVSGQSNGTTYTARLGEDALLDCRVTSLEKDLVSWFRGASSQSAI